MNPAQQPCVKTSANNRRALTLPGNRTDRKLKLDTTATEPLRRRNQRWRTGGVRRALILGAISLALYAICQWLFVFGPSTIVRRFIQGVELNIYDSRAAALPRRKPDPRIVIVGMDDDTLEKLDLARPYYPLPRTYHAQLVQELFAAGAKVIGFDIMFALAQKDEDPQFARALKSHGNVISALIPDTALDNGEETATFTKPASSLLPYLYPASILVPQPVRWIDPYRVDDSIPGARWPHFGFALVASYYRELKATPSLRDTFHWGAHIDAPIANGDDVLVRYAGPAGTFKPIPYYEVIDGTWRRKHPNLFKGKIVLVGRISDLEDVHQTPSGTTPMPGVEVLANIAQMALTHDYLRQATAENEMNAALVLIILYLLVLYRYSLIPGAIAAVVSAAVWALVITPYELNHSGLWLEVVEPLVPLALVVTATSLYEARRMSDQFERFVPSWVAANVMTGRGSGDGDPTAVDRPVTVVFCDVRNFTEISEKYPGQAAEILRNFFEAGDHLARENGTELDKYVGDEIMLYFFDPPKRRLMDRGQAVSHPLRAVYWAEGMIEAAREIDRTGIAGTVGFRVGIGIATGLAREGLVGVKGRVQNTVIGDVVNIASRLQSATKELNRPILMNAGTYEQVRGFTRVEPLGEILVKGKQEPLQVYGLAAWNSAAGKESQ